MQNASVWDESLQRVWLETAISIAWQSNLLFKHWKGKEIAMDWIGKERKGGRGKTSVQTVTARKLDEKNEVKVLQGIPNRSRACCTTYQLHTGQAPRGNPICL